MDTPTPTSPAKGTAPTPAPAAKGGIVGAHPQAARPRHLAWLSAAVLVAHLGALAWWLAPSHPDASLLTPATLATGTTSVTTASTSPVTLASPPPPTASATLVSLVAPATPTLNANANANENFEKNSSLTLTPKHQFAIDSNNPTPPTLTPAALTNTQPAQPMAKVIPVVLHSGSAGQGLAAAATPDAPTTPATPTASSVQANPKVPQDLDGPQPPSALLATPNPLTTLAPPAPGATQATTDDTADGGVQVAAATKAPKVSKGTPSANTADTVAGPLRVPPSATLAFQVTAKRKGLELPARSTLRWEVNGSTYSASLVIEMPFVRSRSQTSVGSIDPVLGLQPRRFGDKNRTEVATHFDRSRTPPVIRFSANAPSVPLQAQSQDRLSVLFQLAAQVAGAPTHFQEGQRATIHTAGSRDAELWVFRVVGTDHLTLPAGPMDTVHLVREAESAYDNRVDVWLAPALDHLPVRILWTQSNGDVVEQALSEHTP